MKSDKLDYSKQHFYLLPEWNISQSSGSLIVSGGADVRYEIELESSEASFFSSLKCGKLFSRNELNLQDRRILEELITAEIVVPRLNKKSMLKIAKLGDNGLTLSSNNKISFVKSIQVSDLALVIRTSSTYADLLKEIEYQGIAKPHLFVDMAFHHTFSIGPLVFPGETACIACLQGRVSTRWGDEVPPTIPRTASLYGSVVSELVITELTRIASGDMSLTNKTVSWNFQNRAIKKDQLLKVPLCPICKQNKIDRNGALVLPWVKSESITNTI